MKIRPFSTSNSLIVVSPRAFGVLACALLLAPACSSDEPSPEGDLPGAGPSVLSADPDVVATPGEPIAPETESPGAEPFSAPPPDQEPPATETNFLVPPCRKTGPAGDTIPVGDAGLGALDALDAGVPDGGVTATSRCRPSPDGPAVAAPY